MSTITAKLAASRQRQPEDEEDAHRGDPSGVRGLLGEVPLSQDRAAEVAAVPNEKTVGELHPVRHHHTQQGFDQGSDQLHRLRDPA